MTIKERLQEVLSANHSNPTQLAKAFKVNQKTLNSQINGDTAVSASTLLLILDAFDISAEWLMRGEGDMLRTRTQETPTLLTDQIERLREENEILRDEIIRLHLEMGKQRQDNQKVAG